MARLSPWRRRVRFIPQLEVVECGAASLAMVLDFHCCAVPLVDARNACAVSRDGVNATRILNAARSFGLDARGLKLEPKELEKLPLPAILHWEFNHFVVLERITRGGAVLIDPARGRRRVSHQTLSSSFTGVVLAFEPTERFEKRRRKPPSLERYLTVLADEKPALLYVAACAFMLQLLELVFAASTQVLIDHVVKPQRASWLVPITLTLGVALLARQTLQWLRDQISIALQTSLDLTLTTGFIEHLVRLPLAFFDQRSSGDLMQRVEANSELRAITVTLTLAGLDALLLFSYAGLMLAYDPTLGALALGVSLSRVLVVQSASRRLRQGADKLLVQRGAESAAVVEALSAPEMTRATGAEATLFRRYSTRLSERVEAALSLKRVSHEVSTAMTLFDGTATALVIWLGGARVLEGQMTIGVFAGVMILQRMVDAPLTALLGSVDDLLYARAILARIDDVLDTAPEPEGTRVPKVLRGEVVFDQVSFRHGPSTPWLFRDLSFCVHPGEKVALVGRSGQGKSTIMKLLLGLLQPSAGRICLDAVDLRELSRAQLAEKVGVVLQEPFLLEESVARNLRLRAPDAPLAALERAARLACVHDVITSLPHGYDTKLSPQGANLSGGQRQRIAVARALVGDPVLLLLDEATSALDLATEAELHQNLGQIGCTRLLVAHRLATVRDADRILVIDGGAIMQEGRFDELAARSGPFRTLLEASAT